MTDCIDRQAAIDAVNDVFVNHLPTLLPRYEDMPLKCALAIMRTPSAQPEIIRCKDCKYYINNRCYKIKSTDDLRDSNDYCSYAERREE